MDFASLVALAGNTLVAAAVTDAWETARHRIASIFGRGQPDRLTQRRLEATRQQLIAAPAAELRQKQAYLAAQWAGRLADLLEERPDAESEVRAAVDEIRAMLSGGSMTGVSQSIVAGRDVRIEASGGSVAARTIYGDVRPPDPTSPGPVIG